MMIVNPDGTVHRHQKIDGEIVELKPLHNPDIIAPVDPLETVVDSIAYWFQTLREIGNPAEMVFEQGGRRLNCQITLTIRKAGKLEDRSLIESMLSISRTFFSQPTIL